MQLILSQFDFISNLTDFLEQNFIRDEDGKEKQKLES